MYSISHVGLETELDVGSRESYLYKRRYDVGQIIDGKFQVDTEYYDSQVEFKTLGKLQLSEALTDFRDFVTKELTADGEYRPYAKAPAFVGTHLHMFLKKDGRDFSSLKGNKLFMVLPLYAGVMKFFQEWFDAIPVTESGTYKFDKYVNPFKGLPLDRELQRVLTSNNVTKYFDVSFMKGDFKRNLNALGLGYVYSNIGNDRPKYQPLIWSLARPDGKPLSLEARLIPNAMFLLAGNAPIEWLANKIVRNLNLSADWELSTDDVANRLCRSAICGIHSALCMAHSGVFRYGDMTKEKLMEMFEVAFQQYEECQTLIEKHASEGKLPAELPSWASEALVEPVTEQSDESGEEDEFDQDSEDEAEEDVSTDSIRVSMNTQPVGISGPFQSGDGVTVRITEESMVLTCGQNVQTVRNYGAFVPQTFLTDGAGANSLCALGRGPSIAETLYDRTLPNNASTPDEAPF